MTIKSLHLFYFTSFLELKNMVNILPFGLHDKEYSLIK